MKNFVNDYIGILIHHTDLALTSYVKAKLEPLNIAPEQNLIMLLLLEKNGLTQNEIAQKLNKDKTNIARMISNLEKKGFIRRHVNEVDRRSLNVYLTDCGEKLGEKLYPIAREHNQVVCSGISEEELLIVQKVLMKMRRNVENNAK
ncbi:MarR family winged helix-turn-helix transcriptional regulator [Litchfieldia salsa]|uniref:DNA-binding transcriptional regulator, MarR family n=1 Tax=Litchfieldia salsa TaxID=930152 RepID=A0A1H0W3V7_9BACI|nr:MarR family transcriptional regulator [Litchfieldia salsa]SDP85430.1 DNA-binding transcriptional regulator, MarR family [Litchfieldia salsa]